MFQRFRFNFSIYSSFLSSCLVVVVVAFPLPLFCMYRISIYASRAEVYIWQLTHSIHPKTDGGFFVTFLLYCIFFFFPLAEKHFSCGMERKYYARVLFTRLRFNKSAHLNVAVSVAGAGCLLNNYCEIF